MYFTPGPSALFYTVEEHMKHALKLQIPSIAHRGSEFIKLHQETTENLSNLLQLPPGYQIAFTSSATEVWERIPENLVENNLFYFSNGAFSSKFGKAAEALGINATGHNSTPGTSPEVHTVNIPSDVELIGMAQNETSTGAAIPPEDIYKLREVHPDVLIAVDVVSSIPVIDLDFSKIDAAYFSVQKCFGLPAGLGVWIFNERCMEKARLVRERKHLHETYHSIFNLSTYAQKHQTPCTPNVLGIYLLGKVAGDMLTKGLDMIRRETAAKAALIYHLYESNSAFTPFVQEKKHRSKTVGVASIEGGSAPIISALAEKGLIVGNGYGEFKDEHMRIANFPTHSKEQMELLVDTINSLS